jgi:ligand-binding SRPBCC domain-containing protein
MKLHLLERSVRLPISIGAAWNFFSSPANLPRITPPWLGLRVTGPLPERMHPGLIITYAVRPFPGFAAGWVTEITHVVEPSLFVDEQRFGPYRFWHHQHHFREVAGGTEVRDVVHFALPRGTALAAGWLVRRRVEAIFSFRGAVLHDTFGTLPEDRA